VGVSPRNCHKTQAEAAQRRPIHSQAPHRSPLRGFIVYPAIPFRGPLAHDFIRPPLRGWPIIYMHHVHICRSSIR
jgi:hypothetical protein